MARKIVRRYLIDEVEPGMELSGSLVTDNGKFALGEGTLLTPNLIERLKGWGVECVEVRVTIEGGEREPVRLSEQQAAVSENYNETVSTLRRSFETVRFFKQVPLQEMRELADTALDSFINTSGALNHLLIVHRKDDYTFHHSINVAVLCGILGRWLGYRGEELRELVMAGLLHDIGKTQIPLEILRKPGMLTGAEMEVMRLHTTRGYNLVKDMGLPAAVTFAILQHHEREDGSGYPLKVAGERIHPMAKIVAVADIYDAITSETVYRKKRTPFEAVEALMKDMYDKLDPNVCTAFLNNVRDYFIGNIVVLSDGREAEVVYLGQYTAARPVVKTTDGEFIDLEQKKELSICELVRA